MNEVETLAIPPKWLDRIASRVKLEMKRLDKQVRAVVREQILRIVNGKAEAISPTAILNHIGLTDHQAATVERARQRLLAEGKLKGQALEKDLDKLRAKLLRERANLIAEHETRVAHSIGQRAAWEKLFADGKLKGGKRHWHKLWVASADERTCGVCMDIDGTEVPVDALFDDQFYAPPDPHPRCRCSIALVETTGGYRSPKEGDAAPGPEETLKGASLAEGRWITKDGKKIFIGGDSGGGGGGGGGAIGGPYSPKEFGVGVGDDPSMSAEPVDPVAAGWTKVHEGSIGGHSYAEIWVDKNGDPWYVKKSDSWEQQANEVIAGKLYALAGIPHTFTQPAVVNGAPFLASKMVAHAGPALPAAVGVREGFATDAWLANWDVAGKSGDNTVMGPNSLATRIESGGALLWRGMEGPKKPAQFTGKVMEVDIYRGGQTPAGNTNPTATYLFSKVTEADIAKGIREHVAKVTPDEIHGIIEKYGQKMPQTMRAGLEQTLLARQQDLVSKLPDLDKAAKVMADTSKLAPGKVFNLSHAVVKGSGQVASEPKPAALSAKAAYTIMEANTAAGGGKKWTLDNWSDPAHPRPDEFGAPTNPDSPIYQKAMSHAQAQISAWKGSAQSPGAQQLRRAAIEELGAMGMVKSPEVGDYTKPLSPMDRMGVRVLYNKTQTDFAAAGISNDDRFLLYRGLKFFEKGKLVVGEEAAKKHYTTPMVLEGFSTQPATAEKFNKTIVIPKVVPPQNILFSWDTSVGSTGGFHDEKEYFVLHGPKFEQLGATAPKGLKSLGGQSAAKAAPQKPPGWGGTGPTDLNALAQKYGFTYSGKQTVPKIELPEGATKITVPKPTTAAQAPISSGGSGGADAYIAQYKGTKYAKSQIQSAFEAINQGKGESGAAAASGINQHTLHGMIHEVKTKYGGVKMGGATVVPSGAATPGAYVPSATAPVSDAPGAWYSAVQSALAEAKPAPAPPKVAVPKVPHGTADRPASVDKYLDPDSPKKIGKVNAGTIFDKDAYLYHYPQADLAGKKHPYPLWSTAGYGYTEKADAAFDGGYYKLPVGDPTPSNAMVSSLSQQVLGNLHMKAWQNSQATKITAPKVHTAQQAVPSNAAGKPGIDAFCKKYGSSKYSSAQIAQVLSLVKAGKSTKEIAAQLGMPVGTVHGLKFKSKGWI